MEPETLKAEHLEKTFFGILAGATYKIETITRCNGRGGSLVK